MESTTAGTLVTTGLKRLVKEPCWNLNLRFPACARTQRTNVFVQFPCSVSCLSFHLRRTYLSLQLVVCFCSVVHRTVYTCARSCLSARTIHNLVCIGSSSRLCRPHKNKTIAMSSMFAPAHFSCSHSTPFTLSSSSSIPSSRTSSQVKLPINKHCATSPNEESGPLANTTSPTNSALECRAKERRSNEQGGWLFPSDS